MVQLFLMDNQSGKQSGSSFQMIFLESEVQIDSADLLNWRKMLNETMAF